METVVICFLSSGAPTDSRPRFCWAAKPLLCRPHPELGAGIEPTFGEHQQHGSLRVPLSRSRPQAVDGAATPGKTIRHVVVDHAEASILYESRSVSGRFRNTQVGFGLCAPIDGPTALRVSTSASIWRSLVRPLVMQARSTVLPSKTAVDTQNRPSRRTAST